MDGEKIHAERCARDPMYHLCYFPQQEDFQRQFLTKCIELVHKKYGSAVQNDKLIQRIFGLLHEYNDAEAIFMACIFMMVWEHEVSKAVEQLFALEQDYTLHGQQSREHFRKFLHIAREYVEKTTQFPFNKTNIIETAQKFREACTLAYMTQ